MRNETIKEILIRRDGVTPEEAEDLIQSAKVELEDYLFEGDMEAAENICQEYFGLEPDYLMELL